MSTTSNLEKSITSALADESMASSDLEALCLRVCREITEADQTAISLKERALDVTQTPNPVQARYEMDDALFAADRLRGVLPRLHQRLAEVQERERGQKWLRDLAPIQAEQNELADELRRVYPEIETRLVDLLTRIKANDERIAKLHAVRPAGLNEWLRGAELVGRELDAFTRDTASIAATLQLPSWTSGVAWPPRVVPLFEGLIPPPRTIPAPPGASPTRGSNKTWIGSGSVGASPSTMRT